MFREAVSEDMDLLHGHLVEEARQGRFDRRLAEEPYRTGLRRNLVHIRKRGRRLDQDVEAQLLVWEQDGQAGGCVINSAILPGAGNEIWMIAVMPSVRGTGIGRDMTAALLAELHPRVDLYARCAPQAAVACDMFLRRGFLPLDVTDKGVRVLKLPKMGASLAAQKGSYQQLEPFVRLRSVR